MLMLDSDVLIDILRQYPAALTWLRGLGDEEIALSGFVVMELLQGCMTKNEQIKIQKLVHAFEIVWSLPETCNRALDVFSGYHLSHGIGFLDAIIGQTAVDLNIPLATFNRKHYAVIFGLVTINPYNKE